MSKEKAIKLSWETLDHDQFRIFLRDVADSSLNLKHMIEDDWKAHTVSESTKTDTVPKTEVQGWMFVPTEGGGTEPIGTRILETPEDLARVQLRDSEASFIAYVPTGAVARGRTLVTTGGNGRTQACTVCHGTDLRGLGPLPALAGRSPSYIVRQLYDLKTGVRNGAWSDLMDAAVANLTVEDMVNIAAYTASLAP